jgi:hypothetical protein
METEQKEYKQYYTTQADQQSAHQTFVRYLRHKYLSGCLLDFVVVSKLRSDPAYNLSPAEYVYFALSPSCSFTVCRSKYTCSERILSPSI